MRDIGKPRICRRNLILDTGIESDKSLVVKLDPLTLDRAQNWASGLWHSDVGRLPNIFGRRGRFDLIFVSVSLASTSSGQREEPMVVRLYPPPGFIRSNTGLTPC